MKIQSILGGNCRLRVTSELRSKGNVTLKTATGSNPNPLFVIADTKKPFVSEKAGLKGINVNAGKLYDFNTTAGTSYEFAQ
ncbi:hypothetical protein A4D02_04935 [Niastella koreensis]|uniref:Uncharacterized protein n=1 Tax=Niastella koreensis TaxID=354356 RepID=A0ABX3P634_9BACT|nr:hypothetical protein [Niastella koreensis]OQP55649.1 hypothetical protein A4D02_04935 [Niastella koreensis]